MRKILTTLTIPCLALCYSDIDAGGEELKKKSTHQKLQRSFSEPNINKKVTARSRNEELLHIAVQRGQIAGVKRLIELGTDINSRDKDEKTALMIFAEKGDLDMVEYLVRHGANDLEKALRIAKNKGYKEIADYLNSNLPSDQKPGNEQVLQLLLAGKNAIPLNNRQIEQSMNDPYKNGKPVSYELLQLVREGNKEKINEFIKKWPTIGTNDKYAEKIFTLALGTKDVKLIKYLLENKFSHYKDSNSEKTPLHLAAYRGHENIVKYLVEYGADINAQDIEGETALHNAASRGHENIVKYLVEHRADINKEGETGWTALHFATVNNHENIVKYLVEHGADINKENGLGQTALDCAERTGIRTYLVEHGATTGSQIKAGLYLYTFNE